jgi:hypothetical protein
MRTSEMTRPGRGRRLVIVAIALGLSAAFASDALAAGHGAAGGGRAGRAFQGAPLESVPATVPTFNPSIPYTVPQAPETPVSPASPGSVFGNH